MMESSGVFCSLRTDMYSSREERSTDARSLDVWLPFSVQVTTDRRHCSTSGGREARGFRLVVLGKI